MPRTVWTTLLVLATAAAVGLPAQRNRDRDFGLSQEEWCREARRSDVCEVREETGIFPRFRRHVKFYAAARS